jgi:pimeloyl-ACP methyl ester carboxylesterase
MNQMLIRNLTCMILLFFGLIGYGYADNPNPTQSCEIATRQVALDGGVLYYNQAGQGVPVLLLHGLFAQKEQWNSVLCLIAAAGYAAIAPDLPGYGKSIDFPLADYKLDNQVERLRQFMETLGISRFDIAGSSMGGAIAAFYVERYPRQIRTLAFIGSPLGAVEWGKAVKNAIYQGINPFIPITVPQFDLEMSLLFVKPPTIPDPVKEALVKDYTDRNRHYQQVWDIVNLYDTLLDRRLRIRTPTLILWGKEDRIFATDGADQLRFHIPRSRLVRLPNAGHLPQLENPSETAAIYRDFLKSPYARQVWQP